MNQAMIEERIHAAIRPQLSRADRALWELKNPRTTMGWHDPRNPLHEISSTVEVIEVMEQP